MKYNRFMNVILTLTLCLTLLSAQEVRATTYTVTNTHAP